MEAWGIGWRALRGEHFEDELRQIHSLALESFRQNFLYSPIEVDDFLALYRDLRPFIRPELVFLLEQRGRLVGFLFGIPDYLQGHKGAPIDTVLLKTLALHPGLRGQGLGRLMVARFHEAADRLGYRRVIHALMHEDNHMLRISRHTARPIRQYTLYARPLS